MLTLASRFTVAFRSTAAQTFSLKSSCPNHLTDKSKVLNKRNLIESLTPSYTSALYLHSYSPTASNKSQRRKMSPTSKFQYPVASRQEIVEKLHDTDVQDPYRWLEDPNSDATKKFIDGQNKLSQSYFNECPFRTELKTLLTTNQNYMRIGCPFKRGEKYYFFMNTGLQPQSVLYQQETLEAEPTVFFDPNTLSDDGTVALSVYSFSPDGDHFAYSLSTSGSDWLEIHVRHIPSGKDLEDKLTKAKFTSIEWTHDNKGFFYAKYPKSTKTEGTESESVEFHSVFYHTLNTSQDDDVLKVHFPDQPQLLVSFEVSHDGLYLHVFPRDGCSDCTWYYSDLREHNAKNKLVLKPIYETMEARFDYITNNGETVYFKTNLDAENCRIVKLNLSAPQKENWIDVIPNHTSDVLDWAEVYTVNNREFMLVNVMRKVAHYLELFELEGQSVKKFDLPPGTVSKHSGRRNDNEFFFHFTSFLSPGQVYHFDMRDLDSDAKLIRESKPNNFDASEFIIEQVFYSSKDKTEVPMFIIQRKDLSKDGSSPCILYGYGGFNAQLTSAFNINRIAWLKNFKGVLAVANIRGGGELGEKWHHSGRLLNKQNCFDDFIAAAEYLISNKYTRTDKLAIQGGSNGGLLVAATSNQRPDLFGATICHVGVLDMIRYASFTIGHAWKTEYGDATKEKHFHYLLKYSPYHNIPDSHVYPATLLLTASHDDRVVPAHSLKFIAELQHKLGLRLTDTPLMIRIDTKAGHSAGRPISKILDEYLDIYSFLSNALGLHDHFQHDD